MQDLISFITIDVESTSIKKSRLDDDIGGLLIKEGMPLLLEIFNKYEVKSTFFFTGEVIEKYPDLVRMILPYNHEVASHGHSHSSDETFDVLNLSQQIQHLTMSKDLLQSISGTKIISFRAPALRVNEFTPKALLETGFCIDSSVAPQRLDSFITFGSKRKLKWILAPRKPYYTSVDNLSRRGNSGILEIPVSSFIFPYIGTALRVLPSVTKFTRRLLYFESKHFKTHINFLIHPNEIIEEEGEFMTSRRTDKFYKYILSDLLRSKLKQRNLGRQALDLFEEEIKYLKNKGCAFITLAEYYDIFKENKT